MTEEYLKQARKNGLASDSPFTEAELIQSRADIKEMWLELGAIRHKIFNVKQKACEDIDKEFYEELKDIESTYAMLLSLAR